MYRYSRVTEDLQTVFETAWELSTDEGWTPAGKLGLMVSDSDDAMDALEKVTAEMLQTVSLSGGCK